MHLACQQKHWRPSQLAKNVNKTQDRKCALWICSGLTALPRKLKCTFTLKIDSLLVLSGWELFTDSKKIKKNKRGGGTLSPPTKKQNILNLPRIVIRSTMQFNSTSLCLVWNISLGLWFKPPFPGRRTTDLGDVCGLPGEGVWGGKSFYNRAYCLVCMELPHHSSFCAAPVCSPSQVWKSLVRWSTGMCNAFPNPRSLPDTLKKCSLIGERWNPGLWRKFLDICCCW